MYEKLENMYIKKAAIEEYEKYIEYMKDPVKKFVQHVDIISRSKIYEVIERDKVPEYIDTIDLNLGEFRRRLEKVRSIMARSDSFNNPCNFFVVK